MSQPCARKNARSAIVALLPGQDHEIADGQRRARRDHDEVAHPAPAAADRNRRNWRCAARRGTAIVHALPRAARGALQRHRILGRQLLRGGEMRDQAERRPAGAPLDEPQAVGEQARVAAKLVDEKADDHRRILGGEHRLRADDLRDDAAAIDVADQHHRRIGGARKAHIGDVARAQVDLRGAAGAFDQHEIGLGLHAREAVEHGRQQLRLHRLIFARLRGADDAALHHDLRADLALRLQQHRVHVDARRHARGARLQRLRAADLAAVRRHRGVVRHVLRLERAHSEPARREGAAEPGDDQRLADVGARALEHQRARGSKLDALLRAHAGGEMMLDERHLGDEIGRRDQLRLGVAAGDDDMEIGRAAPRAPRRLRAAADSRSAARC